MGLRERRRQERRKSRIQYAWQVVLIVVVVAATLGSVGYWLFYHFNLNKKEEQFEELRTTEEVVVTEEIIVQETEQEEVIYCEPVYDFAELRESNEDIYAWIVVPGTMTDYPVLQSETDNYYLEYNLDHSSGYPGCIYTNKCNAKDFSDYNVVLYGHNMKNGSMFGSLHRFEDETFFEENRNIYVYTEDVRLTYEVYAAVKFTDYYIPSYYDVATIEGRDAFVQELVKQAEGVSVSHILEDMELLSEDKLITLSTCVNGEREKRYLIVGRLVEEAHYSESSESISETEN